MTITGFQEERNCKILNDELYEDTTIGSSIIIYSIDQPLIKRADSVNDEANRHAAESVVSLKNLMTFMGADGLKFLSRLDEIVQKFNDKIIATEELSGLHVEVRVLVDECIETLASLDRKALAHSLCYHSLDYETLNQIVETYLMESTYEVVYFRVSKELRSKDLEVADAVAKIKHLDFPQLGLSHMFGPNLVKAVKEFQNISIVRTPFEKIKCLMRSVQLLSSLKIQGSQEGDQPSDLILSSDTLVPLLVLMVVRSDVQNLQSSLFYIQQFTFEHDVISGEYGFAISSLEAVISYICSHSYSLASGSDKNIAFWDCVRAGNIDNLRKNLHEWDGNTESVVECRTWDGEDALLLAVKSHHSALVSFLLALGFSPNTTDYNGTSALHLSCLLKMNDIGEMLLHAGAPYFCDINAQNAKGLSALHLGSADMCSLLLSMQCDREKVSNEGLTPLLHHCQLGNTEVVSRLIEGDVRLDAEDLGYRTCLHICAFRGYTPIVKLILAHQATSTPHSTSFVDVSASSLRGNTPLHAAAEPGHLEIVQLLVGAGSDPTKRNLAGLLPADIAKNDAIKDLLDSHTLLVVHQRKTLKTQNREGYMVGVMRPDIQDITTSKPFGLAVSNPGPTGRNMRKLLQRLNHFLDFLLCHPIFATHELLWEFLLVPQFQKDMLSERTKLKLDSHIETITESYPTVVESLELTNNLFKQAELTLVAIQTAARTLVATSRKVSHNCKALAAAAKVLSFSLARATASAALPPELDCRRLIGQSIRLIGDKTGSRGVLIGKLITDGFSELLFGVSGAMQPIPRFWDSSNDYAKSERQSMALSNAVTRCEGAAKAHGSEEKVKKLSEVYFQYSQASRALQQKAALLNYSDISLKRELTIFHEFHGKAVFNVLHDYADDNYKREKDLMNELLAASGNFASLIPSIKATSEQALTEVRLLEIKTAQSSEMPTRATDKNPTISNRLLSLSTSSSSSSLESM
ncbi:hypothetical protein HDU76_012651 [Blyttiomyces sp. JEL0837]|nr:hypothetical protein HDU76_012651 [Blyttiomyces sp. JEL0837]